MSNKILKNKLTGTSARILTLLMRAEEPIDKPLLWYKSKKYSDDQYFDYFAGRTLDVQITKVRNYLRTYYPNYEIIKYGRGEVSSFELKTKN